MSTNTETTVPLVSVDGLTVRFEGQDTPAVGGVSWSLERGQVLALVGESGSGKSVTAFSVLGLLPATATVAGSVRLAVERDGQPVELVGASSDTLRGIRGGVVGLVSQEPMNAWNPVLTIGWQIIEAVRTHAKVSRAQARERLLQLLHEVGLPDPERVARSYPHQLSGGQLQRALIAMSLSADPVALIADEPTTALDVTVQAGILELLRSLRDSRGMAIVLITHDMGVVADLADEVVVMRRGLVVEKAPAATLFSDPQDPYTRELLDAVPRLGALPEAEALVADQDEALGAGTASSTAEDEPAARARVGTTAAARSAAASPAPATSAPPVDLRDLHVVYPGARRSAPVHAADGVTLRIDRGEMLGLVGESGSGKSTVGQVLAGLVPATSGSVRVCDVDLREASRREQLAVRKRVGVVFQDPASTLNPRWTIAQAIGEPLGLHTSLRGSELRERVAELLEVVQLSPDLADRFSHELSGGQRQRVSIARAVALDPDVLIADEPTSALDVSVQQRVLEVFADLQQRLGFSCLFISHNLAVVERVTGRVAVMHQGRIVEQGPTRDVLGSPQDPYTQRLLAAAPVADPTVQADRRAHWLTLTD
ncbi:ATPase component of various ABC-type transport systems with duplicated ATPase domain [Sanguibacter keddieii DSM 10542]|uniref:ATPase component of various ABC-type transport systems with duplicated ATPase domain n=1 Tax=Sanguibacter keddieii (strain ATCC 51767 / DSM 10542 / NCFB 3025 / ST-74) TaxID=446469 RepID=D1BJE3_SANKS|nr:ABC transporter ATP-binding protein [Sanguibacter keddieii]ACZ22337.1 ATPase component of various ABC-type transport systems with duplicated ATPase domain [Sanguibacter keddieii DSM 10542]